MTLLQAIALFREHQKSEALAGHRRIYRRWSNPVRPVRALCARLSRKIRERWEMLPWSGQKKTTGMLEMNILLDKLHEKDYKTDDGRTYTRARPVNGSTPHDSCC